MTKSLSNTLPAIPRRLGGIPFSWQDVRTTKVIREAYTGKKRTTAIAIYQTLTELATNQGRLQGKHVSDFPASLQAIAEKSGKSVATIKRYVYEFRLLKILAWKRCKKGFQNLPNIWRLCAYTAQYNELTSMHHNEPIPKGHNNEPVGEERVRKYLNKKRINKGFKLDNGLQPIGDILG